MVFNVFTRWLFWILVLELFVCVVTGGKEKRSVRKRPPVHSESTRSLQDWLKLSKEALRLACNAINIQSTGSQAVLARRLFENYRQDSDQQATSSSSSSDPSPIVAAPAAPVQVQQNDSLLAAEPEFDIRAFLRTELQSFLSEALPINNSPINNIPLNNIPINNIPLNIIPSSAAVTPANLVSPVIQGPSIQQGASNSLDQIVGS